MAFDHKVLRRAQERFEADRQARLALFAARRAAAFRREPRLREIQRQLHATTGHILSETLRKGTDPAPALLRLRNQNLALQEERKNLMKQAGITQAELDDEPLCPLCQDRGYRDGSMCRCLRTYYAQEQQKELSRLLDLGNQSFDTFSLDWYSDRYEPEQGLSPRENMDVVYESCVHFAHSFGREPQNLLLFGGTGLGKTFLSAAIAREVSAAGFSVVYDTASHVFDAFTARKFSREDESAEEDVARVLRSDLLILDDLGTEATSPYVQSALYEIINTRLLDRRSTILNTNLRPSEIARRYSPQVASRIDGEYQILPFFGEDIRRQKKNARRGDRGL